MRKKNKLKAVVLLFVWTFLMVIIPFVTARVERNRFKNNGSYLSSEFEITDYNIILDVDKNNRIDVTENIFLNIPGDSFNGIYKSIPKWLNYYDTNGNEYKKKIKITNLRASGEKFFLSETNDSYGIKIGSQKTIVNPGIHTYKIMYHYNMGKDIKKGFDELVFNIFDNYDKTKIDSMMVTINMPYNVNISSLSFLNEKDIINDKIDYSINGNTLNFRISGYELNNSVTVRMVLPDNYFAGGTSNYGTVCFILCILLLIIAIYSFYSWQKYGKNYEKYTKTVEYYAPEGLDAAQVGYIYGEKSIVKLVTSLIIGLASKGIITIEEVSKKKYKIIDNKKNILNKLTVTENIVYQELFKNGNSENVISDDPTFVSAFSKVNACLEKVIGKRINDYEANNKMIITFSALFFGIILWISAFLYIRDLNPIYNWLYVLSFASIFITGFFAIFMNRKTSYGEMISARVLGFKDYLESAEKDQLDRFVNENPNYFYDILPYTYVLNVSEKWIKYFEKKVMPNIDLGNLENYENGLFMIMSE